MSKFILTERDRHLFKKVYSMGVMTTRQIERSIFPEIDSSTVLRRLRKLHARGFLEKEPGLVGGPYVWTLTSKTGRLLGSDLIYGSINRNTLEHETLLTEIRLKLEEYFVTQLWVPGHELKKRAGRARGEKADFDLVPDGIFHSLRADQKTKSSFILELELVLKSKARYANIFQKYRQKTGEFYLWYIVPHARLGERLCAIWLKTIGHGAPAKIFVWTVLEELLQNPLETKLNGLEKTFFLKEVVKNKFLGNQIENRPKAISQTEDAHEIAAQTDDHRPGNIDYTGEDCPEDYPLESAEDFNADESPP